jgi:hypothetical protein
MTELKEAGRRFVWNRVTGGWGYTRGVHLDPAWESRDEEARRSGLVRGVYGFPVNPDYADMDDQLDVFLNTVGDFDNRMIMVDYEKYGPHPAATCTVPALKAYIRGIRQAVPNRHIVLYSNYNFWNEEPYTGKAEDFGPNIVMMHAWYWRDEPYQHPLAHYHKAMGWNDTKFWHSLGGRVPEFTQFCTGYTGDEVIDQDAYRLEMEDLMRLTRKIA